MNSGFCSRNFACEMPGNLWFHSCFTGCEREDACGFATVTPAGAGVLCELYSAAEVNFNCTASGLVKKITRRITCFVLMPYLQRKQRAEGIHTRKAGC